MLKKIFKATLIAINPKVQKGKSLAFFFTFYIVGLLTELSIVSLIPIDDKISIAIVISILHFMLTISVSETLMHLKDAILYLDKYVSKHDIDLEYVSVEDLSKYLKKAWRKTTPHDCDEY